MKNLDGKGQVSRELDAERRAESVGEIGQRCGCHKFDQLTIAKKPFESMDECFRGSQVTGPLLRRADDIPLRFITGVAGPIVAEVLDLGLGRAGAPSGGVARLVHYVTALGVRTTAERFPITSPVAWTRTYTGKSGIPARVFFTTLGRPYDFKLEPMRKLALGGIFWALGMEDKIPADGIKADPTEAYGRNNSGFGQFFKAGRKPELILEVRKPR